MQYSSGNPGTRHPFQCICHDIDHFKRNTGGVYAAWVLRSRANRLVNAHALSPISPVVAVQRGDALAVKQYGGKSVDTIHDKVHMLALCDGGAHVKGDCVGPRLVCHPPVITLVESAVAA